MKFLIILLAILKLTVSDVPRPEVSTNSGRIRGTYETALDGTIYQSFQGIPYATPPIGDLRFRAPQPVKPWRGVWSADLPQSCLQYRHYVPPGADRVVGSENCLFLNIYSSNTSTEAKSDVIIFVHGGAFMYLNGHTFGPRIIMSRDVVYCSLNYRLGPLGFLSTEDEVVPGNNGIKDQVMAMKWIKKNIKYFGGNPDSITLSGMSAGGASVHLHYMSPLSKGLFNRGFSMSGTALNPWVITEKSREKAQKLAASVGCTTDNMRNMVDCLRNRPAFQIVSNVKLFFGFLYNQFTPFGIVVEPKFSGYRKRAFLTKHPYQILKNGEMLNLPWITSICQAEGLYPAAEFVSDPTYLPYISANWAEVAPQILAYNDTIVESDADSRIVMANTIKTQYLQERPINRESFPDFVQLVGDRLFAADSVNAAKMHAKVSKSPVYYYYFNYRGTHSLSEKFGKTTENLGVSHGDDTDYVFSSGLLGLEPGNDTEMSKTMLDFWISYAKTGVPKMLDTSWPKVKKDKSAPLEYLKIDSPTVVNAVSNADLGRGSFWLSLQFRENAHLFPDYGL